VFRRYLPALISTILLIILGIGLGLVWVLATGRTDMPWWLVILLTALAGWISDLAEQALRGWRRRRQRTVPQPVVRKAA
jgi:NAD/NADP transhydrogenase beta subunit